MDGDKLTKKLLSMKEQIQNLEKEEAVLKGKLEQIQENLQKEFGISTIEEAEKVYEEMKKEIEEEEFKIEEETREIEKVFEQIS